MAVISASKLPEIFGGPQLVLSSLHSLTLADRDNQFQFSTIFLPRFLCPKLKELRVLLCTGDRRCGYKLRETSVARSPPIDGLRQLLHSSSNLRRVTILHAGISGFRYELESDHIGKGLRGTMYGYLVFHGTRGALQSQVADRLGRDAGLSSRHSLSSLSQLQISHFHSPEHVCRYVVWAHLQASVSSCIYPFPPLSPTLSTPHHDCHSHSHSHPPPAPVPRTAAVSADPPSAARSPP